MKIAKFIHRPTRALVAAGLIGLAATSGVVAAASPAEALPWSSHVTMYGLAECSASSNRFVATTAAEYIWVRVDKTGEIEENSVSNWTRYFSLSLNTIPSSGSGVSIWLYCNVPGSQPGWRYVADPFVNRPWTSDLSGPWLIWA